VQGYVDEAGQRYADVTDPFRGTTQRITVANVRAAGVAQLETVTVTGKRDMELARYEAMKDAVNRGERVDVDDMVQLGRRYDPTNPWVRNPTGREAMTGFVTTVATGTAGLLIRGWAFGAMRTAGYGLTASGFTAGVVGDLTTQTLDNGVYFASSGGYGRRGINATELALSGGLGALPGKSLTLYPDAFSSSEELVRTLGHERTHIYQARTFGPPQGIPELNLNEAAAYGLEDSFVKYWRSRGALMFSDWLNLYKKVQASPVTQVMRCPECGNDAVDFQYVGDRAARRGYLDLWCRHCGKGVHLSRVAIPEGANIIDFDAPEDVLTARIPNFEQVVPAESEE